ncbi:MAG: hypothetical protein A2018_02240 [Alphaproteobacteria bacterium GWF2_58_20]|nr:MAG: hypothetical protein A2018_02240 [Alphaproteobacteria bacterium GWF2_58_20]
MKSVVLGGLVAGVIYAGQHFYPASPVSPVVSIDVVWLDPINSVETVPVLAEAEVVEKAPVPENAPPVLEEVRGTVASGNVALPSSLTETGSTPSPVPVSDPVPLVPAADVRAAQPSSPDVSGPGLRSATPMMEESVRPMRLFAKPFTRQGKQPIVAVVIEGLGMSHGATTAAVQDLPGGVSLAYSPYAPNLSEQMERARVAGHELLLMLPMQPAAGQDDAGPDALMTVLPESTNMVRLKDVLGRGTGYVGVMPYMGGGFMASADGFRPVLRRIWENGLLFVGGIETPPVVLRDVADSLGIRALMPDAVIDTSLARKEIDAQLAKLVETAKKNGFALGVAGAYPVTIERLSVWAQGLKSSKVALAPVSAVFEAHGEAR